MELDAQVEDGVRWIADHFRPDIDGWAQAFETNIRLLGSILSGHVCTGDKKLLALCHDLAERLMPAFDTPTGMPRRFVNLKTGATKGDVSYPAEIGGFAPEATTLAKLTGDRRFLDAAIRAAMALYERRSKIDLIPDEVNVVTGAFPSRRASVGPPSDSYYEYLWDGWRLTGDARFRDAYRTLTDAILAHQRRTIGGRLWFVDVDYETGRPLETRQSELAAFYAGLLAEGGDGAIGQLHMASWAAAQERFGVVPDEFDAASWAVTDPGNPLRPEIADSALTLWLTDRNERWRHLARAHFLIMKRRQKVAHGYSGLEDVRIAGSYDDSCPGFWWSEQMKYYWLLFADAKRFDYGPAHYLSTEGNILRGVRRAG